MKVLLWHCSVTAARQIASNRGRGKKVPTEHFSVLMLPWGCWKHLETGAEL